MRPNGIVVNAEPVQELFGFQPRAHTSQAGRSKDLATPGSAGRSLSKRANAFEQMARGVHNTKRNHNGNPASSVDTTATIVVAATRAIALRSQQLFCLHRAQQ